MIGAFDGSVIKQSTHEIARTPRHRVRSESLLWVKPFPENYPLIKCYWNPSTVFEISWKSPITAKIWSVVADHKPHP